MKQKVFRTGGSLAVVVPAHFVQGIGLKSGTSVKVVTDTKRGRVTYTFPNTVQLTLDLQKS